ncbi:MAG: hypothetical protein H7X94_11990 [Vallitaleaceae bacterium]|nr:hypothetical protein [Vallitaleaceae bacterium]
MEKIEDLNKKINQLYRQLGKNVYTSSKAEGLSIKEIHKMVKKIDQCIHNIEMLKSESLGEEVEVKTILPPEKNEQGFGVYYFCKKCSVGNNPASTHCINCGMKLYE